jgi:hypothetical protein
MRGPSALNLAARVGGRRTAITGLATGRGGLAFLGFQLAEVSATPRTESIRPTRTRLAQL